MPRTLRTPQANGVASAQVKAGPDSAIGIGCEGINLQEESESEQESEPHGGDRSAPTDHSVGSGRRRVGFLLWFCLTTTSTRGQ